jgi:hypothetical protein
MGRFLVGEETALLSGRRAKCKDLGPWEDLACAAELLAEQGLLDPYTLDVFTGIALEELIEGARHMYQKRVSALALEVGWAEAGAPPPDDWRHDWFRTLWSADLRFQSLETFWLEATKAMKANLAIAFYGN